MPSQFHLHPCTAVSRSSPNAALRWANRAPRRQTLKQALLLCACLLGFSGCEHPPATDADPTATAQAPATGDAAAARSGPPGFLDPAPPMPTSDTLIFSGGTLLGDAVAEEHPDGLFDAIVVVRDGILIGYGRRGSIDVPADSVGIDTSGQFIAPTSPFEIGTTATFDVYSQPPRPESGESPRTGRYADGRWQPASDMP